MPTRYKDKDGIPFTDDRPTIHEWTKKIGGAFASLILLEIRGDVLKDEPTTLWAQIRTTTEWEPKWFQVEADVTFTLKDLGHYQKKEAGAVPLPLGGEAKQGRALRTKSKFRTDRREYV